MPRRKELWQKESSLSIRERNITQVNQVLSQRTRLFIDLIAKNENSEEKIKEIAEQYFINKKKNINPIFVIDKK